MVAGCASGFRSGADRAATTPAPVRPKVGLALGGGAARGFAHIGVIKTLEAHGVLPDLVAGTSAGAVVGALYSGGLNGFDLQRVAMQMEERELADWSVPDRGVLRGEALQGFVNRSVQNRPIESLARPFGAVVTDLQTGEMVVFRRGNTGMAVRASSSVPGVFQPVAIGGNEYVDGGLVSPVPVRAVRAMGADVVIAVDISSQPRYGKTRDVLDVMLQTFSIMGQSISRLELGQADIVIRPEIGPLKSTDFEARHQAILEGERAALAALPEIKAAIARKTGPAPVARGR